MEGKGTQLFNINPTEYEYSALTKGIETSSKCPLDFGWLIQPPAEYAIAYY
jgi:hypothetical protein